MDYAEYLKTLLNQKNMLLLELNENKGFIVDVEKSETLLFLGCTEHQIKVCKSKIKRDHIEDPKIQSKKQL